MANRIELELDEVNFWSCGEAPNIRPHTWIYRGRVSQLYFCTSCLLEVTKRELKEATDA